MLLLTGFNVILFFGNSLLCAILAANVFSNSKFNCVNMSSRNFSCLSPSAVRLTDIVLVSGAGGDFMVLALIALGTFELVVLVNGLVKLTDDDEEDEP